MKKLYKTTIVIWADYDTSNQDLEIISREATSGDCYCDSMDTEIIANEAEWPDTEFFGEME